MSILHCVVTHGSSVLAKHSVCEGNFGEIVDKLLEKIPCVDEKKTYYHGKYLFHYVVEKRRIYLCITEKTCQRSRAFLFLNEIKRKLSLNGKCDFTKIIAEEIYRYSEDYANICVRSGELDELNKISVESSEQLLGEQLLIVNYSPAETIHFSNITDIACASAKQCAEIKHAPIFNLLKLTYALIVFIGIIYLIYSAFTFNTPVIIVMFIYFISKWKHNKTNP